ncbi:MAG: response regulator transcription factor [Betaproteobacteria bacterium]|nr:response regulator transcription factor [Betaproteobacteria bacterium]
MVVEDAEEIAQLLKTNLGEIGAEVTVVADGRQALSMAQSAHYDLIVLDLMLPGLGGLDLCRALRNAGRQMPILMLTAKSSELDRVVGLESGADDYVIKPFSVPELMARVRAIFRRMELSRAQKANAHHEPLRFAEFLIDPVAREVLRDGKPVALTSKEFDLLFLFASNPGRVYTRRQLLDFVWGSGGGVYEHTVNSHINRLRAKIEADPAHPILIETVWGVGYRFNRHFVA